MANKSYLAKINKPQYISDELLKTIDMVAQARDSELSFDKTIIGEIISLNNAETGEYYVSYQQGKFKAYAPTNLGKVYAEGVNVYVKIPGGDFSAKKLIEGIATSNSIGEETYDYMSTQLIEMAEAFSLPNKEFSLVAGETNPDNFYYEQVIYDNEGRYTNESFKSLLFAYPRIKISAEFKTDFKGDPKAGNYGLKVEFYTENPDGKQDITKTYTRKLEIANFSGSLNEYQVYSPQYAVYDVDISNVVLTNIKKITFFQEHFDGYDKTYDSGGNVIYENKNIPNIFINNIKVSFCDIVDETGSLYYVGISAPRGLSLMQDSSTIELKGLFYYGGKDILNSKNCTCYWFKQNPDIIVGHELYNQYAGPGWEDITNNDNINFNIMTVKGSDVYQQLRIKLVVLYNQTQSFSKEILLKKDYNQRFAIITDSDGERTFLQLLDGSSKRGAKGDWYATLEDGSYIVLDKNTDKININEYLNYSEVYFQVSIPVGDKRVPYDYTIKNLLVNTDVRVVYSGPDTFLYDANGDIAYSESKKEMLITPKISVGSSTVISSISWYAPNSAKLYEYPISPANSMLYDLYIDNNNIVHFKIRQTFVSSHRSNTLELRIETSNGDTYYFNKTINFVKEGEQGVSGLTYTLVVEQCDENGNEIETAPMMYSQKEKVWRPIYIRPVIYENGQQIINNITSINGNKYHIKYTIQPINVSSEETFNGVYKINGISSPTDINEYNTQGQYFVRIVAKIELNGKTSTINYYYPVLVGVGDFDFRNITNYNVPNSIIYNTSGGTPQYQSEPIEVAYQNVSQTSLRPPVAMNDNIYILTQNSSSSKVTYRIQPVNNYNGSFFPISSDNGKELIPMTAIKIFILTNQASAGYIIQPITMLLSDQMNKGIEGYDGSVISVVDDQNIDHVKEVKSSLGIGKLPSDKSDKTFSSGLIIGTENNGVCGLYAYDTQCIPSNVLKSDGTASLINGLVVGKTEQDLNTQKPSKYILDIGDGFITVSRDKSSTIATIKGFGVVTLKEDGVTFDPDEKFKEQVKKIVGES